MKTFHVLLIFNTPIKLYNTPKTLGIIPWETRSLIFTRIMQTLIQFPDSYTSSSL